MLTIEQANDALDDLVDRLPEKIFDKLNGGIIMSPDICYHPESRKNDLYILGQYRYEPVGFGRYIIIYYGSFNRVHGHLPDELQIKKLEAVLCHELVHHLEGLAGDRSLEHQDAVDMAKYLRQYEN